MSIFKLISILFVKGIISQQCLYTTSSNEPPIDDFYTYENNVIIDNIYMAWNVNYNENNTNFFIQSPPLSSCDDFFSFGFTDTYNNLNNSDVITAWMSDNCTLLNFKNSILFENNNNTIISSQNSQNLNNLFVTHQNNSLIFNFKRRYLKENLTNLVYTTGRFLKNNSTMQVSGLNFFDIFMKQQDYSNLNNATNLVYLIFSLVFFITFCIGLVLTHSNHSSLKFMSREINIPFYGYLPLGSILFFIFYFLWWISIFVYSFLTNNVGQILFRTGLWISLNLSIILFPITRNSIWVILFDLSRERILYLHKILSILCFISVLVKFVVVLIYFPPVFLITLVNQTTGGSPLAGTYATFAIFLCSLLANPYIRKNHFEVFFYSHKILSALAIIFGILHYFVTLYYVLPSILLYIIDIIVRYRHTYTSIFTKIENVGLEKQKTTCTFINATFKNKVDSFPGCYFFLCIPKEIARFQWHPLSLISNKNENFLFCAKNFDTKTWSGKLRNCVENDKNKNMKIKIQGPYGKKDNLYTTNKYKNIMMISGGIGVTPMISIAYHLDELYYISKLTYLEVVKFIWVIPHESMYYSFEHLLKSVDKELFIFDIYITKSENKDTIYMDNITLYKSGRPNIIKIITDNIIADKNLILACGPGPMTDDIRKVCSSDNIDLSCETFD